MKLHYMGKYDMDPEKLPRLPHKPGAVKFKEAEDTKRLAMVANGVAVGVLVAFGVPSLRRADAGGAFPGGAAFLIGAVSP